jgi:hypothetical protein
MIRKFPAKQWNRQNDILLHETIPFKRKFLTFDKMYFTIHSILDILITVVKMLKLPEPSVCHAVNFLCKFLTWIPFSRFKSPFHPPQRS